MTAQATGQAPALARETMGQMLSRRLRSPAAWSETVDLFAILTAASLPWSTSLAGIFNALMLLCMVPFLDVRAFLQSLKRPICVAPIALVLLALVGTLWSDAAWGARFYAVNPTVKLLVLPVLLYHFERSSRGRWIFVAFLVSCALLSVMSWLVALYPNLALKNDPPERGIFVKNYIDQSQEFTLCAFALALPALTFWRGGRAIASAACLALILLFAGNMVFVASSRTALLCIPVLLALFAWKHLSRRASLLLLAATLAASALAWTTSPYLRQRITDIAVEYRHGHEDISRASTAQRLTYWRKSLHAFAEAPLIGHGTGSIKRQFERAATGESRLDAEIVSNPHNQTLNVAVQWGLLGVVLLYAMWIAQLRLFPGEGLAAWIGLVVVVQNIASSLLNSHLFDFHEGWMYVLGVGVAGGMALRAKADSRP